MQEGSYLHDLFPGREGVLYNINNYNSHLWEYQHYMFRELLVKRIDLQAPTLLGPPRANPGSRPPSCTTPQQPTIYFLILPFGPAL